MAILVGEEYTFYTGDVCGQFLSEMRYVCESRFRKIRNKLEC